MDAITTAQASKNLEQLIEQVIANLEPAIVCNDNGKKAILMALDEFRFHYSKD